MLIDKVRGLLELDDLTGFENVRETEMAQALIAVDDVLKKYESILQPLKIKNNMKDEMCQEIRQAIESAGGGDETKK